jgi:hypothetical protein
MPYAEALMPKLFTESPRLEAPRDKLSTLGGTGVCALAIFGMGHASRK